MNGINYKDQAGLERLISEEFGDWSRSITVTQRMINDFADLSGDHFWIHVDADRCKEHSPFGCTIAHGFLVLSLITRMPGDRNVIEEVSGYSHMLNYGSDKLRFLNAVPVDSELHARSRISDVTVSSHKTRVTTEIHVHVVGQEKPAVVCELIFVFM